MGNIDSKEARNSLSENQIISYALLTGFSRRTIIEYHESFLADCPTGRLSK